MIRRRPPRCCLVIACALGALAPAASAAGRGDLALGFSNDGYLTAGTDAQRAPWITRARLEGASIVRVDLAWSQVAPARRGPGFDPRDPASPGYDWSRYDEVVRDLEGHGLQVLLTIAQAPAWAEGPGRPQTAAPGSWRPDPAQLGDFAAAAGLRYSGRYPDPARPAASLPRVRFWEVWNEPNLDGYLAPQWVRAGRGWRALAPVLYRGMVNAAYRALKRVSAANFVLIGATAPYGDPPGFHPPGQERTAPVAFYRALFCLRGARLVPTRCAGVPRFDGLDHHPYGIGGPNWHAIDPDDAAVPDLYKIRRVLDAALRAGHALPRSAKALWVAEFGWSSRPPNPRGIPVRKDARWYEQALYVLWRQGVSAILPLELGDPAGISDYEAVFEGGLYYADGRPKPIARAFRFPFITVRAGSGRLLAWGRAPESGRLVIEVTSRRGWLAIASLRVRARQVFTRALTVRGLVLLRGSLGAQTSLPWPAAG